MSEELTRQQFCAAMQVSESTVRRWELDGLPYTPIGHRGKRYDIAECKRWLRSTKCQDGLTPKAFDTLPSKSTRNEFTEGYRRAVLRVMPST